jgi:hypothetical protein
VSGKAGIGKVLDEAAPALAARLDQAAKSGKGEQLPLLPGATAEGEKRGRGRPEGARSRRTDEMVRYLNRFGEGPLVGLAKVVNAIRFRELTEGELAGLPDFRPLARALGMKVADAATFWRQCAGDLAPYMHQKLPIAVDVTGDSAGSLVVVNLGAVQGDPATDLAQLLGGRLGEVIDGEIEGDEAGADSGSGSEENQ